MTRSARALGRPQTIVVLIAIAGALAARAAWQRAAPPGTPVLPDGGFIEHVIAPRGPANPHCKGIGDFNGDGRIDVVVCSAGGEGLYWYENPGRGGAGGWTRHAIRGSGRYSTDMRVADVDGDGRPDVVVPKSSDGNFGDDVYWYANPGGDGTGPWAEHHIGKAGAHDVQVGDLNGDGRIDVVVRLGAATVFLNQGRGASWRRIPIAVPGHEGTVIGDFDGDGDMDIAFGGDGLRWAENAGGDGTTWRMHEIAGGWPSRTGLAAGDVNGDGRTDIGATCSESADCNLVWYEQPGWQEHVIERGVSYVHTFKFRDMDGDGCLDAVWGEMHQSAKRRIAVSYNRDCKGGRWETRLAGVSGIHNLRVGDLDGDGDPDIFGTNWSSRSPDHGAVKWLENPARAPAGGAAACCTGLDRWHYIRADSSRQPGPKGGYFGLGFGDLDGDGLTDIVSGRYLYRNPGRSLAGAWPRTTLPVAADAHLLLDIDGDGKATDIIAESLPDVYWIRAEGAGGTSWAARRIARGIPRTGHVNGRTMRAGRIVPGSPRPDIVMTAGGGIYVIRIPPDWRTSTDWPHVRATRSARDEQKGLALGDVDRDGRLDIITGEGAGATGVLWYRNPGDGSGDWTGYRIGETAKPEVKMVGVGDLDCDGRPDIVATEENRSAGLYWYAAPADPAAPGWTRHAIATGLAELDSLSVADMNGDGHPDVVVGEIFGPKRVLVYESLDCGRSWHAHEVDRGKESHSGAIAVDLNGDGRKDIVSIAYFAFESLHIWRNDGE